MKMGSEIDENQSMRPSWSDFGAMWCHLGCKWEVLGPSWLQFEGSWTDLGPKWRDSGPILASSWGSKSVQIGSKSDVIFSIDLKIDFWTDLMRTLPHLGPQNPPKMRPSWLQNRVKLGCCFETCFWMDFEAFFLEFCIQCIMAEVAKSTENL